MAGTSQDDPAVELELDYNENMDEDENPRHNTAVEGASTLEGPARIIEEHQLENLMGRILSKNLMAQISKIVRQETALALAGAREHEMGEVNAGDTKATRRTSTSIVSSEVGSPGSRVLKSEHRLGGEIIDTFYPNDVEANVYRWLTRIDQLGEVHGWIPYKRVAIMQERLPGQARSWFNRLDNYDFTWAGWKERLQAAFPRRKDYAAAVRECLNRRKLWNENMTRYYQDKLALCEQCRITGEDAVSFIIDGLPRELQANAHTQRAKTPEEVYTGFLTSINDYVSSVQLPKRKA